MNTNTQHTPGPWRFHLGRGRQPRLHIQDSGGYQIASIPARQYCPEIERLGNEANARLIAAAPDLLEALEMLLESEESTLGDGGSILGDDYRMTARSAIAKATGID